MFELSQGQRASMIVLIGIGLLAGTAVWLLVPHHGAPAVGADDGGIVTVAFVLYLLYALRSKTLSPAARRVMMIAVGVLALAGGVAFLLTR